MTAAAGWTGQGGRGRLRRAPPAPVPQRGPLWQAVGRPRGGGLGANGRRAGVSALAGARRMKGHSCYAMCGAGAALGQRTVNTLWKDTGQEGQRLNGSQRPERAVMIPTNKNLKRNRRNSHHVRTKCDSPNNSPVHALRSAEECGNARSSDDLSELAFCMELENIQTDMNELKERMVDSYVGHLAPKRKGSYKIVGLETYFALEDNFFFLSLPEADRQSRRLAAPGRRFRRPRIRLPVRSPRQALRPYSWGPFRQCSRRRRQPRRRVAADTTVDAY